MIDEQRRCLLPPVVPILAEVFNHAFKLAAFPFPIILHAIQILTQNLKFDVYSPVIVGRFVLFTRYVLGRAVNVHFVVDPLQFRNVDNNFSGSIFPYGNLSFLDMAV